MTFTMKNTTVLAVSLLLNPALYGMQNPQEITLALRTAARHCDVSAYKTAAQDAIFYAEKHPQVIRKLTSGHALNSTPMDLAGHTVAISYGLVTNNHLHTAVSTTNALVSAWTLLPTRTEEQDFLGLAARITVHTLSEGIFMGPLLLDAITNYSWQTALPLALGVGIRAIPFIREQRIAFERARLAKELNEIENNTRSPEDVWNLD